jgi:phosphate starvation-inducible PhoH-like protein
LGRTDLTLPRKFGHNRAASWAAPMLAVSKERPYYSMIEATISVGDAESLVLVLGTKDQHLKQIRETIPAKISTREGKILVQGEEDAVLQATAVLEELRSRIGRNGPIDADQVSQIIRRVVNGEIPPRTDPIGVRGGRAIHPRTAGQTEYVEAIRKHALVFCTGPAGTGKTYLAVATAVEALKAQSIRRIVLVRPAVEAGESLGYLPGDLQAKINPYLRPLLDALREMMDYEKVQRYMDEDVIEVVPLAYMRGRTLNRAFIILDEAQNTTVAQMKMFLTRMGEGSQVVVSGDTSQIDLPPHTKSGLIDAIGRLRDIDGYALVKLTGADIFRHRLVQDIVRAYDEGPKKKR